MVHVMMYAVLQHNLQIKVQSKSQIHIFKQKKKVLPVNNFSVMSGKSQPSDRFIRYQSSLWGVKMCLLKDTWCHQWGLNQGPLDSESDALPLGSPPEKVKYNGHSGKKNG